MTTRDHTNARNRRYNDALRTLTRTADVLRAKLGKREAERADLDRVLNAARVAFGLQERLAAYVPQRLPEDEETIVRAGEGCL